MAPTTCCGLGRRRHLSKILHRATRQANAESDLERIVAADPTIVRAHQHAAGARQKGLHPTSRTTIALGRSRGADGNEGVVGAVEIAEHHE